MTCKSTLFKFCIKATFFKQKTYPKSVFLQENPVISKIMVLIPQAKTPNPQLLNHFPNITSLVAQYHELRRLTSVQQ